MRCWLLFHRELLPGVPEAAEVLRFQQVATRLGIELKVLQPRDFELVVASPGEWSAIYQGRSLPKPDLIIARTGSETSYFTLAVLRHFERLRPRVMLLDIGLPGISGTEVARRLRAMAPRDELALIAITGWGQRSDREATAAAGFDAHLVKPVEFNELERVMQQLLGAPRAVS